MANLIDLTGKTFGHWTVLSRDYETVAKLRKVRWWSRCACGTVRSVIGDGLRSGVSQSCGCRPPVHHNAKYLLPEYYIWAHMLTRCSNPRHKDYAYYGARGIGVCERWRGSFDAFFEDLGKRPTDAHTLERVDNDGDYEPRNCCWATREVQANNRRLRSR